MKNGNLSSTFRTLVTALALGFSAVLVTATPILAATTITYRFDGGGWGHGIGLSQWGALGYATRANDPMTYDRILAHYYQGTKLVVPSSSVNPTVRVNLASNAGARNTWRIQSGTETSLTLESVSYPEDEITLSAKKSYWIKTANGDLAIYNDKTTKTSDGKTQHVLGTLVRNFPGKVIVQESDPRVVKTGTWAKIDSTSASGGSYLSSSTKGRELSIKFEGTSLKLFGKKGPTGGRADIYLDGVRQTTVDFYRSSTAYKQSIYSRDKLTSGVHTIKIVVLGTRSAGTGYAVNLDGIDLFEGVRASAGGKVMIATTSGPFDHTGVRWRGSIRFVPYEPTSAKAINYVDLESYLWGVVPRESGSSFHIEALKAQAVAARSYAYQDAKDGRAIYCTVYSQVYNGESRGTTRHEATSTTNAVNATKGKLVWYEDETKPVKTFFFSSSGGYTANVEDVWGSTPRPYYTGVVDLDNASPHYTWTVGPLSASTVSSKVRTKLSSLPEATATVVAMSVDRATTGHVKTAYITWSDGKTSSLRGDTLRSALSMRSSKFDVLARVEAPGSAIETSGTWKTSSVSGSSGGTHMVTNKAGSWARLKFSGTSISWIGAKYKGYGIAEVWLDGKKTATVDLYSATTKYQQKLYTKTGLGTGTHTLQIRVTGKKNASATAAYVPVDAYDVRRGGLAR